MEINTFTEIDWNHLLNWLETFYNVHYRQIKQCDLKSIAFKNRVFHWISIQKKMKIQQIKPKQCWNWAKNKHLAKRKSKQMRFFIDEKDFFVECFIKTE